MGKKRNRSDSSSVSSSDDDDGGDFVDTNKRNKKKKNGKQISKVVSDSSSSSSDVSDGEWNAKPKKNKNKRGGKGSKKATKKKMKAATLSSGSDASEPDLDNEPAKNSSDEKEEGEVDFSDDDNEEFNDGFDENLMGDEEDKRRLAQMTEKEREQELFNRSEKREVLRTRFEIERKLRLAKKQEKMKSTDKSAGGSKDGDVSFTESACRSIERRRNMEDKRKVKDAMKGLKAEREKKKEKLKQKLKTADVYSDSSDSDDSDAEVRPSKKSAKKSSTSEEFSSSSSMSEDSDVETRPKSKRDSDWDQERSDKGKTEQEVFDLTIQHLNSIRLSRHKVEQWCHAPFFRDTVMNAFVRVGIGNTSMANYAVGQIVDVVETSKIYTLGKTRTNKGIKLKFAHRPESVFRLEYISNQEFTVSEFEQWYNKMISEKNDLPTKDLVLKKQADIVKAINYNYSEHDVEVIVNEKGRFKDKPINFAMRKTQLFREKEFAEMNGNHEKAMEISKEIDRIEEESKKLDKMRTQNIASISFINERNRMWNLKEAERAAMAEGNKGSQAEKDDPFTRRKCTPMMIHVFNKNKHVQDTSNNDTIQNPTPAKTEPTNKPAGEASNGGEFKTPTAKSVPVKPPAEDQDANDMFNVHNFDIKIDFENLNSGLSSSSLPNPNSSFNSLQFSGLSNLNGNMVGVSRRNAMANSANNRRSLNLDEYKKKKGLI